jgi:hypothetical protein
LWRDLRRRGRRRARKPRTRRRLAGRYPFTLVFVRGRRARRRGRCMGRGRRRCGRGWRRMADFGLRMRRCRRSRMRRGWRRRRGWVLRRCGMRRRCRPGRRRCGRSGTRRWSGGGRTWRRRSSRGRVWRCRGGGPCRSWGGLRRRALRFRLSVGTEFFLGLGHDDLGNDDRCRGLRMRRGGCERRHRQSGRGEQHETKVFHVVGSPRFLRRQRNVQ